MEILNTRGQMDHLKKEYQAHPEKYPKIPGHTYWIVIYKSDGTKMKKSEANDPAAQINSYPKIEAVENGLEKYIVTFPLN